MGPRKRAFNDEFMERNFSTYHKTFMGRDTPVPRMGYPDCGSGYYSAQLPYKEWFEFNCAQRIHGNSIEHMAWLMPLVIVSGLFRPKSTAFFGSVVIAGRELYRMGYQSTDGPNSVIRELGAVPLNAAEIFMILGLGTLWFTRRYEGLFRNRKIYKKLFADP